MRNMNRICLALLALVLLLLPLTSCSSQKKQEQAVIGSCAGYDVLYEELRYVTLTYKDLFAATYGADIWNTPESAEKYRAELESTVWAMMRNNYAVLATCKAYGMTDEAMQDDAIEKAIEAEIKDAIESYGGKSEFKKALQELHMTEHFLRFCLRVAQLENELLFILTDDLGLIENDSEKFLEWLNSGNCVYVQHVFIRNDPTDDIEANRALAEDVRMGLSLGTDISEYIGSSVNEDLSNITPYYLVRDVYAKELESAAFALESPGDVSEVVDTGDGYYILVRMEEDYAQLLAKLSSLLTSYQWARVESLVDKTKQDLTLELSDYGKSLDLLAIK